VVGGRSGGDGGSSGGGGLEKGGKEGKGKRERRIVFLVSRVFHRSKLEDPVS